MEKPGLHCDDKLDKSSCTNQQKIVADFFNAVAHRQKDAASKIIAEGLISPDTPNDQGETPLITAVLANDAAMVRMLAAFGAPVDGYGLYSQGKHQTQVQRTPLQVAAAEGKLGMVKVLRDLGANDSLIAPDGAMALRLAAENSHREVVNLLPARRGGAWKRWKVTHETQMRRVRRILDKFGSILKYIAWTIPKFLFWTLPKHIVLTVPKQILVTLPKEIWERRYKIGPWCKRQVNKFPDRMKRAASLANRGMKKAVKVMTKTPAKIWRIIKRIPGALRIIILWIWKGIGKLSNAALNVVSRVASFFHTTIGAVASFFRAITVHDIVNGLRAILRAISVDVPKAIAWFVIAFGKTSGAVLETVLGSLGKAIFYLAALIFWLIRWLPKKLWKLLQACGISAGKGVEEILVWINPKRM
ncbi:hypothetical protein V8C37DRAFT_393288 [Trichoderma ceciliae]